MAPLLGELLVQGGLITPVQLEVALHRQVAFGGRLGTSLVESGAIDLAALTAGLARQHHLPGATVAELEAVTPETLALVARPLAELHGLVPLRVRVDAGVQRLVVAVMDPLAQPEVLGFMFGMPPVPVLAPELRIMYYLEKLYGLPRKARFLRIDAYSADTAGSRPPPALPGEERRRYAASHVPEDVAAVESPAVTVVAAPSSPSSTPAAALDALAAAVTRDHIGDALAEYLRAAFAGGLVLICKDGMALGWKGFAPGLDTALLEAVAIPLSRSSFLGDAYHHGKLVRATPAQAGTILALIWRLLGAGEPKETIVAPIMVKDRVIVLVYAHASDGGTLSDDAATGLAAVCAAAGAAFTRLIQAAKARSS